MAGQRHTTSIRDLSPEDREIVANLRCVTFPRGWEARLPELVQMVADAIGRDDGLSAIGAVDEQGRLQGVAAWRQPVESPDTWVVPIIAVQLGVQRRGIGRSLKLALLDRARSAGIRFVISTVHCDNAGMLKLNEGLGARMRRLPADNWDGYYLSCIIPT